MLNGRKDGLVRCLLFGIIFTAANSRYRRNDDIYSITDFQGGVLIKDFDYTYPTWIYDVSRADIGYNQKKAKQLIQKYE